MVDHTADYNKSLQKLAAINYKKYFKPGSKLLSPLTKKKNR